MKIVVFCHSLRSDWNHGNAHFLRGVMSELRARGHDVKAFEPEGAWSFANLTRDHGVTPLREFTDAYPGLRSTTYSLETLDLGRALDGVDLALVHEWNEPELVRRIGACRRRHPHLRLLFHDTHHRVVSQPHEISRFDLTEYDGVLAFGDVIREVYAKRGLAAWTWHEAADVKRFRPRPEIERDLDLAWIGNWGDDERSAELREFLFEPSRALGLKTLVHGVRYPDAALAELDKFGIKYGGWVPNYRVPELFARAKVTAHVPRRPYVRALPGIPTIRVFEALACGIPLVSAPWDDREGLFRADVDFLRAADGQEMRALLKMVIAEPDVAAEFARRGRETILAKHTCAHRVDELFTILDSLGLEESPRCLVQ